MPHPVDVPPGVLLPRLATALRESGAVAPPLWASYVKTGVHKQRAPMQTDWWYLRTASVLRKISVLGPTGIERLASEYGGKKDRGSAPSHARTGSRSILREIVQQLERAGLVEPQKKRGRRVSASGMKLLDTASKMALEELSARSPELKKYL